MDLGVAGREERGERGMSAEKHVPTRVRGGEGGTEGVDRIESVPATGFVGSTK